MFGIMMASAVIAIVAKAWLYPAYDGIINNFSRFPRADMVLVQIYIYIYTVTTFAFVSSFVEKTDLFVM